MKQVTPAIMNRPTNTAITIATMTRIPGPVPAFTPAPIIYNDYYSNKPSNTNRYIIYISRENASSLRSRR